MTEASLPSASAARAGVPSYTLRELVLYFVRLGTVGFGGPIALVGAMRRDLVEARGWIGEQDYREGLSLAQLAPGPLAAQLAMYLGWVRGRTLGATLVGVAFVAPSFVMVLAISAFYVRFGGLGWMQGAFYGVGAAVIAIIARSAYKLVRSALKGSRLLWAICAVSAFVTAWTESEIVWLFVIGGLIPLFWKVLSRPNAIAPAVAALPWLPALVTGLGQPAGVATLWRIFWYFAEAGAFVFGSGLAVVPFLYGGVVHTFGWLSERQFLDAVAVAMITPGPVVITVAFIGYLVAGPIGATVAALATFLPCYLLVLVLAPYYRRLSSNVQVRAFVDGVTAAATGAIAGSGFVLGKRAIVDLPTAGIALATLGLLVWARKLPEPLLVLGAGAIGIALKVSA
jgi:chromate transporter